MKKGNRSYICIFTVSPNKRGHMLVFFGGRVEKGNTKDRLSIASPSHAVKIKET
jgi:hypothetical protein